MRSINRIARIIYVAAFFAVCCAPLALMPASKNKDLENTAEELSFPKIVEDGKLNTELSEQLDNYLNKKMPGRSKLLNAADRLTGGVFGAKTANVIPGKDGWLFFGGTEDNFIDRNAMTEQELRSLVVTLSLIQENVEAKGGKFVFVPMPNKNEIYPEYMPARYVKAVENDLSRLTDKLKNSDVNFLDMKQLLTDNKELGLYHKYDSHWNYLGAFIGYDGIMNALGREHKTYENADYTAAYTWRGDIYDMIYPEGDELDKQYEFDIEFEEFRFAMPKTQDNEGQLKLFMSNDAEKNRDERFAVQKLRPTTGRKLYMVRDSFGRALLPFMIDNYDSALFARTTIPELASVTPGTDMVYEVVERNLRNVISTPPAMSAPEREVSAGDVYTSEKNAAVLVETPTGSRISGTIDPEMTGQDGRIYVALSGEGINKTFEAFPVFDSDSGLCKDERQGFSVRLADGALPAGEYKVSVISGGKTTGEINSIELGSNQYQ